MMVPERDNKMLNEKRLAELWKKYENGIDYISMKNLISKTNRNWNFYIGNQWAGVKSGGEELPSFNFIKPVTKHKISTVSQNNMVANYSDTEGREELNEVYKDFNVKFSADWEKANMDMELWATMKDAAVTGDGIQYYGTSNVADMQRLNNTQVLYGDESNPKIQDQPYIIIVQRLSVAEITKRAEANGIPAEEIQLIVPDQDTENLIGNTSELNEDSTSSNSKATCIIYMEKKDGIVNVTECTKTVIFAPEKKIAVTDKDGRTIRGMQLYPLVKMSWEDFPNQARGVSEVEQLLANQLELNKTAARRSLIIKLTAYPKLAYDENAISNPDALEEVGSPIAVNGTSQSINQAISYLSPAQSNSDPKNYADDILSLTQELAGSGETAMGNINPNRVAASAIIAIRDQAALPLNEQVAKKTTFVEDLAKLWLEMWLVYNPNGIEIKTTEINELGQEVEVLKKVTKEQIDEVKADIRVDTSQDNPWTKEAEQNWLDNIFSKQIISFEDYIKLSPEHGIVPKNKLKSLLEEKKAKEKLQMEQESGGIEAEYGNQMEEAMKKWGEQQ